MKLAISSMAVLLFFSSCASLPMTDRSNLTPSLQLAVNSIDDRNFIYSDEKYPARTNKLSREDVQYDAAFLVAGLERAYSGRDHLPDGVYKKLVEDIQVLANKLPLGSTNNDGNELCSELALLFWDVPDSHLYTSKSCRGKIKKHTYSNVGKNIHDGDGYFYDLREVNGKRVGLLSLGTAMPDKKDKSWSGFKEKVDQLSKETDALIIDLRGNRGGMSDNIRWLADRLYGNTAKMADEAILLRVSAATYALDYNEAEMEIIEAKEDKIPVQRYLLKAKSTALKGFRKMYKQRPKELRYMRKGSEAAFDPSKGYNGPIRILIDSGCASACEAGFAHMQSHPNVKSYGVNTKGAYHYGDTKPLVLPRSNILVGIPISYRKFSDGRFIEKKGYEPDVKVVDGDDALQVVIQHLKKDLK